MTSRFHFKTLQGRLFALLMIPVFFIIFAGGILSFLYTRDAILHQWNEAAVLKLQRAAHYIDMRLSNPIEMIDMLFRVSKDAGTSVSYTALADYLETLEGIIDVRYVEARPSTPLDPVPGSGREMRMQMMGMMRHIRHSRISSISDPAYDSDIGKKTIVLTLNLIDHNDVESGRMRIKISFDYLLKDIIKLGWWQSDMACIVDQNGRYMAHTNMDMKDRRILGGNADPLEQGILKQMERTSFGTVRSGGHSVDMVAGFYKLEHIPWTIILYAKRKIIFKPINRYRNAFAVGCVLIIGIILFLIRQHVGKIVKQITALSGNARMVATGDYGPPIEMDSKDEIGQLVVTYNEMVNGLKERDFIRDSFGRYVDPEFAKYLLKHPDAGKLGGKRREVILLMSDIRGFTALSEALSPELIIRLLNRYFSHMIKIIQEYNGIIVDFFGDAILVFFDPLSRSAENTALCCLECACRLQYEMAVFNQGIRQEGLPELAMGIGINAGQVIVGNIGSDTRAKYGVVGSAVNITSRIQATAKANEVVISDSVFHYTKERVPVIKTFTAQLKGVEDSVTLRVVKNSGITAGECECSLD